MIKLSSAASQLVGKTLEGGWTVKERLQPGPLATGGIFSVGYVVESSQGEIAFLKALDYSRAFKNPDPPVVLREMVNAFLFERDVLEKCKQNKCSRVVRAITHGSCDVPGAGDYPFVNYLIFERADGDVRKFLNFSGSFDTAWALRSLHHIATGLRQLHGIGIAHQDLKPSNVLVFNKNSSKIGDVGKAAHWGHFPPHENQTIPGDPTYAPPELLYGHVDTDWNFRRVGGDMYLLGSLVAFFFMNMGTTAALLAELHPSHRYQNWSGSFFEVQPYLRDAFNRVLDKFETYLNPPLKDSLREIVQQLCDPDPHLRGHPSNRQNSGNRFSLERYVTTFDLLARKAELGLLRG